jgi:capsular polysaccharide biosynthesis protein
MSEYGIEIVEPHKYSQEEQIKLFSEASFVIGEYGSAMHNTLFSPPETKVIVLQSDAPLSFIQAGIGAALNQPTGFVFGQQEKIDTTKNRFSGRSFHAPLNLVKQAIEESI